MKKISKRELRAISRGVPGNFEEREFIQSEDIQGSIEQIEEQKLPDRFFESLSELEEDFENILQRLKATLPNITISTEQFDESTVQCISKIFGDVESIDASMYLKMLDIQLSLANEVAIQELEKQEII